MFEQTFVDGEGRTNKSWTVLVSFLGQIGLIVVAVILPLIYTEVLPTATLASMLTAPPPPPPPPPPAAAAPIKVVKVIPRQFDAGKLMAPKVIPKEIATIKEEEAPPASSAVAGVVGGVAGGVAGGAMGGLLPGIIGAVPTTVAPPPPPTPPVAVKKVETIQRLKIGGNVQSAKIVKKITPLYPQLAKSARVSGVVRLAAIIAKDGTIQELHSMYGPALLIQAAMDAVKQWVYLPTMLNGEPVQVETTIDVNFTLSQ